MAIFKDKDSKKIKTTHFGQRGASDYTKHGDKERMERYNTRHKSNENWNDPLSAGALSKWILWNKPGLNSSFSDYKRKFGLKGEIKVSKSAEDWEEVTDWETHEPSNDPSPFEKALNGNLLKLERFSPTAEDWEEVTDWETHEPSNFTF